MLKPTYGVIVYQEQVMQIAQVLARLHARRRRPAAPRDGQEEARGDGRSRRSIFVEGALEQRRRRRSRPRDIFDLMEKFAGYGFNKSHSAAYALLSYQTAYLKAHYPAAFMAAVLSADMDHTDKVVTLIQECAEIGLEVKPPDVNTSALRVCRGGRAHHPLRPGRRARRGAGRRRGVHQRARSERAVPEPGRPVPPPRSAEGEPSRVGSADCAREVSTVSGPNRATLMQSLPTAMQLGDQNSKAQDAGQNDMFGLSDNRAAASAPVVRAVELPEWSESVRLTGERETLGLYLTGHPIGRFESGLARLVSHRIGDLISDRPIAGMEGPRFGGGKPVTIAGLIDEVKKRGPRMILTLDDRTGRIEVNLFDDVFQKYRDLIVKDALVLVDGTLRFDEFSDSWRLSGKRLTELDKVREQQARRLVLKWPPNGNSKALLGRLGEVLTPWRPGPCPITVEYTGAGATGALTLGNEWTVRASRELLEQLETLVGRGGVTVFYGAPPTMSH